MFNKNVIYEACNRCMFVRGGYGECLAGVASVGVCRGGEKGAGTIHNVNVV